MRTDPPLAARATVRLVVTGIAAGRTVMTSSRLIVVPSGAASATVSASSPEARPTSGTLSDVRAPWARSSVVSGWETSTRPKPEVTESL